MCRFQRQCVTRGFAPARRGTFVSAKVPKAICPAVAIQGRMNAASGWIHKSGLRPYCRSVRLAALRFPCSRWQVRGSPSVASPFSGTKVHWTFVLIRFTPPSPHQGSAMYRDVRVRRAHGCAKAAFGYTHPWLDRRGEKQSDSAVPFHLTRR